jgi:hypothetical protein
MESGIDREVLLKAAAVNGIDARGSELIRNGSHSMWRIPGGIVGRLGSRGTEASARREVQISGYLNEHGIRAVKAVAGMMQPTLIDDIPVTWWELLRENRPATPSELGVALKKIHLLAVPHELGLPNFVPFNVDRERVMHNAPLESADADWLESRMDHLNDEYSRASAHMPRGLIHGDAWQGNVLVPADSEPVVIDFEAFCAGPTYWDIVPLAVDYTDFSRISGGEYEHFVSSYGFDVTSAPTYRMLADIQELRWTAFVVGKMKEDRGAASEAAHRIACLRGRVPRPWNWNAF